MIQQNRKRPSNPYESLSQQTHVTEEKDILAPPQKKRCEDNKDRYDCSLTHRSLHTLPDTLSKKTINLDISHNSLTNIQSINSLVLIQTLRADFNLLKNLPKMKLNHLSVLSVSHNTLQSLPELPSTLVEIDVSHNQLHSANIHTQFQKLHHLRILNLSHNKFSSLPKIPHQLTILYLDNNHITFNKQDILNVKNIRCLSICFNSIDSSSIEILETHMSKKSVLLYDAQEVCINEDKVVEGIQQTPDFGISQEEPTIKKKTTKKMEPEEVTTNSFQSKDEGYLRQGYRFFTQSFSSMANLFSYSEKR